MHYAHMCTCRACRPRAHGPCTRETRVRTPWCVSLPPGYRAAVFSHLFNTTRCLLASKFSSLRRLTGSTPIPLRTVFRLTHGHCAIFACPIAIPIIPVYISSLTIIRINMCYDSLYKTASRFTLLYRTS